jgi:hypothetical protein
MLNPTDFIKYIKDFGFPNKEYNAVKHYPNTIITDNKKFSNEFGKKYRIRFIFAFRDANILLYKNNNNDNLFLKSLNYVSNIQKTLYNENIKSYISGGSAIKLYSLINNYDVKNKSILNTSDFDIQLYHNNNTKITNIVILDNLKTIINSTSINIENKYKNSSVLKIFSIMHLSNRKELVNILEYFLDLNYDLYKYRINRDDEENNFQYHLDFVKKTSHTSYIILNLKLKKNILKKLNKCNSYSFVKINTFIIDKNQLYSIYSVMELISHNNSDLNMNLIEGNIKYNNNNFYIFNVKSILYNLINLYHDYQNLLNQMEQKIKNSKDIRDEKRLDYVFKLYCKLFYKNMNNDTINKTLDLMKSKNKKFSKCIFVLKDLSVLNNFFKKYETIK